MRPLTQTVAEKLRGSIPGTRNRRLGHGPVAPDHDIETEARRDRIANWQAENTELIEREREALEKIASYAGLPNLGG